MLTLSRFTSSCSLSVWVWSVSDSMRAFRCSIWVRAFSSLSVWVHSDSSNTILSAPSCSFSWASWFTFLCKSPNSCSVACNSSLVLQSHHIQSLVREKTTTCIFQKGTSCGHNYNPINYIHGFWLQFYDLQMTKLACSSIIWERMKSGNIAVLHCWLTRKIRHEQGGRARCDIFSLQI